MVKLYPQSNWIRSLLLPAVLAGCSPNYLPIGDHKVFMDFYRPYESKIYGSGEALLCTSDEQVCGRRKVDQEEYDLDQFFIEYDDSDGERNTTPMGFVATYREVREIYIGSFEILVVPTTVRGIIRFQFNDSDFGEAQLPPEIQITDPPFSSDHQLVPGESLRVTWKSPAPEFPMRWQFFRLDNSADDDACDLLPWTNLEGVADDVGFLDIPLDGISVDLPPEGCEMAIFLNRRDEGSLPPDLPGGYIRATTTAGAIIRMLPPTP